MKPGELAFFGLAGLLVFAGAVMYLWGGLAGLLWGEGWPRMSLADGLEVVKQLPDHLDDPAQAWPREARSDLPGTSALYAALALTLPLTSTLLSLIGAAIWGLRKL